MGCDHIPPPALKCCYNCKHWKKKAYLHCQCSGPWGGNLPHDKKCTFAWKTVLEPVGPVGHDVGRQRPERK